MAYATMTAMFPFDADHLANICRRHDVARLRVFGSVARGEAGSTSDLDLIVDFRAPKGFFELARLEDELCAFFGRDVDLVTERGLSPYLREPILSEAAVVYDAAA